MINKDSSLKRPVAPCPTENSVDAETWLEFVLERRRNIADELRRLETEDQNLRYHIETSEPPKHA